MLRKVLLATSRGLGVERIAKSASFVRPVVDRFVGGQTVDEVVAVARTLVDDGLLVTIGPLGDDIFDSAAVEREAANYLRLQEQLAASGLAGRTELSVKLGGLGQKLWWDGRLPSPDGEKIALENARRICTAAGDAGATVTIDMEDHKTVGSTLSIHSALRKEFPWVGAVIQAQLRRSANDCRTLATEGSRVRLVKGAYASPRSVAYGSSREVDLSYVRCLRALMAGPGYPMIATHDPRMIDIAWTLAVARNPHSFEFQMLYGVRADQQRQLAAAGARVRVYVPYGEDWYGYLMRRLADRPTTAMLFLRSLTGRE